MAVSSRFNCFICNFAVDLNTVHTQTHTQIQPASDEKRVTEFVVEVIVFSIIVYETRTIDAAVH